MYYNNFQDNDIVYLDQDETDSFGNGSDSIFGLGNKRQVKKMEKKQRKGEKALAQGNIKKAQKKFKKAAPIASKLQSAQQQALNLRNQQTDINRTQTMLNATDPLTTESMNVEPGQIGSESGGITQSSLQAAGNTMGGGGGGIMEDENTLPGNSEPLENNGAVKELPGVTVGNKSNWLLIGITIVVLIVVTVFLVKSKK